MNYKTLVKLSNIIGIISIILLVYWVFVFISMTVFGLKIFRENITETFYLSVVGVLALMLGSLIINVMFNLTRIAEKHNQDELSVPKQVNKKNGISFWTEFSFDIRTSFRWRLYYIQKKRRNADSFCKRNHSEQ